MSYEDHRFLFWKWRRHTHDWVEESRRSYRHMMRPVERPDPAVMVGEYTLFLFRCPECNAVETVKRDGDWTPSQ